MKRVTKRGEGAEVTPIREITKGNTSGGNNEYLEALPRYFTHTNLNWCVRLRRYSFPNIFLLLLLSFFIVVFLVGCLSSRTMCDAQLIVRNRCGKFSPKSMRCDRPIVVGVGVGVGQGAAGETMKQAAHPD